MTTDSFKRSVPRVERRSKKAYASLEIEEGIRLIKAFVQVKDADIRVSLIKLAEFIGGFRIANINEEVREKIDIWRDLGRQLVAREKLGAPWISGRLAS